MPNSTDTQIDNGQDMVSGMRSFMSTGGHVRSGRSAAKSGFILCAMMLASNAVQCRAGQMCCQSPMVESSKPPNQTGRTVLGKQLGRNRGGGGKERYQSQSKEQDQERANSFFGGDAIQVATHLMPVGTRKCSGLGPWMCVLAKFGSIQEKSWGS